MDWSINLTANSVDDSETVLRILTDDILAGGGWILSRSTSTEDVVHVRFEFEREACVEIYTALMAAGLELSESSHLQLAHLCHCTRNRTGLRPMQGPAVVPGTQQGFETARVELRIMPEQLDGFDRRPEQGASHPGYRARR